MLDDIAVAYPDRGEAALDRFSLTIEAGQVVAIVGPSGCGKSTLLSVLLGFVVPDHGSVSIGGVPLSSLDPTAWRQHLAWVPQRPHLFAGSIADNLRLGCPEATDDELWDALAAASLDSRVAALPGDLSRAAR